MWTQGFAFFCVDLSVFITLAIRESNTKKEVQRLAKETQIQKDKLSTVVAKAKGLKTIALTGKNGGKLKDLADICIIVPQNETFMIQELHLPVYHALCLEIEEAFWAE